MEKQSTKSDVNCYALWLLKKKIRRGNVFYVWHSYRVQLSLQFFNRLWGEIDFPSCGIDMYPGVFPVPNRTNKYVLFSVILSRRWKYFDNWTSMPERALCVLCIISAIQREMRCLCYAICNTKSFFDTIISDCICQTYLYISVFFMEVHSSSAAKTMAQYYT